MTNWTRAISKREGKREEREDVNLNPMFNSRAPKNLNSEPKISKPRKQRSDKKHDIKIPVSKANKQLVLLLARRKGLSATKYCTDLVKGALLYNCEFNEPEYQHSEIIVHIKADKELYTQIVDISVDWQYSIRKATHRIFIEALRIETGGIEIEGLQQKEPIAKIF